MQLHPHHVGIVVSDLEASTEFYGALGFTTVSDNQWPDDSRAIRFLQSGTLQLELFWYADTPPAPSLASGKQLGFRHMALMTDDVDVALAELKAAGVVPTDVESRDVPLGYRIAFFNDPNGLEIELSQQL
jgi:catechol 2,3-dioxygenase-like lactoylglutathione lyase family enzyme